MREKKLQKGGGSGGVLVLRLASREAFSMEHIPSLRPENTDDVAHT